MANPPKILVISFIVLAILLIISIVLAYSFSNINHAASVTFIIISVILALLLFANGGVTKDVMFMVIPILVVVVGVVLGNLIQSSVPVPPAARV